VRGLGTACHFEVNKKHSVFLKVPKLLFFFTCVM